MQAIRFGIVGTGNIARRFAQGLQHVPGAELAQVWNRNRIKAHAFATEYGAHVCEDYEALLASDIDAVYIATPHTSHAPLTVQALAAGKHVLCEKPAAVSLRELDEVLAAAKASGKLFMEAMKPPFYPLFERLREQLAADPIGKVRFVRAGFASAGVPPGHAVLNPALAGGSLLDIGIYAAFLAVDWLGPALDVQTLGRIGSSGVDTFASIQSQHATGIAQLYCGLDTSGSGDAMIGASGGHVVIREKWWNPLHAVVHYRDGRKVEIDAPFEGSGLNYETAHFCDLIREGRTESNLLTHAHSRAMIQLIDAARAGLGLRYPFETE
ncbi:Predicted dehydrogenase [Andreprevotia lacus DSM 23236]|jgi:predicted dehydrogenase|uniref:Predicted dehydrogenase n=1 Tax=Andreprevotia lacus DSM 23236 TaxID=1121001 RepID=A0A1W1XTM1_9NEIS|nr:Gfo/Idh/MocA family oxidoreductase [Andreprevotia lacus]SMC27330.1 Predicted dehydrogenase [Andreprevotia lacus DSM 23236]